MVLGVGKGGAVVKVSVGKREGSIILPLIQVWMCEMYFAAWRLMGLPAVSIQVYVVLSDYVSLIAQYYLLIGMALTVRQTW